MKARRSSFSIDMTKGNEMAVLIRFAFPLFIGNLVQQLYGMADSIIVGRYINADALGAGRQVKKLFVLKGANV